MSEQRTDWIAFVPQLPAQLWLLAAAAFVNFLGYMVTPFLVLYLTEVANFSIESAGVLLTCFGFAGIAGTWSGGRLSDRIGAQNVLVLSFLISDGDSREKWRTKRRVYGLLPDCSVGCRFGCSFDRNIHLCAAVSVGTVGLLHDIDPGFRVSALAI